MDRFDSLWMTVGISAFIAAHLAAAAIGVHLSAVDWREHRLPTRIIKRLAVATAVAGLIGMLLGAQQASLLDAAIGAAMFGGPILLAHLVAPAAMGFGDVRLGVVLGLWIGWHAPGLGLVALLGAFLLAFPPALWRIVRGNRSEPIPFGPYLIAAACLVAVVTFSLP